MQPNLRLNYPINKNRHRSGVIQGNSEEGGYMEKKLSAHAFSSALLHSLS
jgi:hypothetical protein